VGIVALFSVTQPDVSRLRAQGPSAHAAATLLQDVTMPKTGFQFDWRSVLVASGYCHIWLVSVLRRQLRLERSVQEPADRFRSGGESRLKAEVIDSLKKCRIYQHVQHFGALRRFLRH
jgi:hypothetical protein